MILVYQNLKPLLFQWKLTRTSIDLLHDHTAQKRLVGQLLYLTITKPNLSYLVQVLSQLMDKSTHSHMTAAQCVLRYLKSTPGQGIFISAPSICHLKAFSDSNQVSCVDTRSLVTIFYIFLGILLYPVSQRSILQFLVHQQMQNIELQLPFLVKSHS